MVEPQPAAVITGAASGIGREIARLAGRDGLRLLLVDRLAEPLQQVAAELADAGSSVDVLVVDLCDPRAGEQVESALAAHGLYADVLVNCAGAGLYGPTAELDRERQLKLLDVNARALTELTLRFLPGMIARGRGGILNVGSITGRVPGPYMAVYYASKAYARSFSAAVAAEVCDSGVTVTCLMPGPVNTPFFNELAVTETRMLELFPPCRVEDVAEAGWRGFKAGRQVVVPDWRSRLATSVGALLPDAWVARVVRLLQEPPKAEQT